MMDTAAVIVGLATSVPATIAALAAYNKSKHTARKIGDVGKAEQGRLGGRSRRFQDVGLSINTTLGIMHADIIDVRDEQQETRKAVEALQGTVYEHLRSEHPRGKSR